MLDHDVRVFTGGAMAPLIPQLARLRIQVFREFPYLYEGDEAYERAYLRHYAASKGSIIVAVFDSDRLVGASTGLPLVEADDAFRQPIQRAVDLDERDVFYFGESILLTSHRGRGIGHRFFDEREAHAAVGDFAVTAFCAVDRPPHHPRRPDDYRPLDGFWTKRGYVRRPDLTARYAWKDLDDNCETDKQLTFWLRRDG